MDKVKVRIQEYYRWKCPNCGNEQDDFMDSKVVVCRGCNEEFEPEEGE